MQIFLAGASVHVVAVNHKKFSRIIWLSYDTFNVSLDGMLNRNVVLQKVKHARKLLRNVQLYDEMDISS